MQLHLKKLRVDEWSIALEENNMYSVKLLKGLGHAVLGNFV